MNRLTSKSNQNSGRKLNEKLKVFAGCGAAVAAIGALPTIADADIVQSLTAPIATVPNGNGGIIDTPWDVDNDGTRDFELAKSNFLTFSTFTVSGYQYTTSSIRGVANFDDQNGGRLVVPSTQGDDGISKLPLGVNIGPTLSAPYNFHAGAQASNKVTRTTSNFAFIGNDAAQGGWSLGDTGFFGFKFTNVSGTHFGWGEMAISTDGTGFQILQAYYNDTPNGSIAVGATTNIPEPSSVTLLALGAAGLASWRRRRQG